MCKSTLSQAVWVKGKAIGRAHPHVSLQTTVTSIPDVFHCRSKKSSSQPCQLDVVMTG